VSADFLEKELPFIVFLLPIAKCSNLGHEYAKSNLEVLACGVSLVDPIELSELYVSFVFEGTGQAFPEYIVV
jgi:hypothetical protein